MDGKEVVWLSLAILTLLVLVEIAYNLVIYVPSTNYPSPPPATIKTTKSSTNTVIFNPIPYYSLLPTIINSSSLTACCPKYILISIPNGTPILSNIIRILSMNASEVTPSVYWKIADLGGFYVNQQFEKNVTYYIAPLPFNANGTQPKFNLTKLILQYYTFSPYIVTYPPSDNVTIGKITSQIINVTSANTSISANIVSSKYSLISKTYSKVKRGNDTYIIIHEFYQKCVTIEFRFFIDHKLVKSFDRQFIFHPYGGSYYCQVSGATTVYPGVEKEVYAIAIIKASAGFTHYIQYGGGNVYYCYYIYYPEGPNILTQGYTFNWYKYNVSLPINIQVYNGTLPVTEIGNKIYHSRIITNVSAYMVWSSDPKPYTVTIETFDRINFANYSITRKWNAGTITISFTCYVQQLGNTINYYLKFSTQSSKIAQQPQWVFNHTPENAIYDINYANEYGEFVYYYALYKFLYELVQNNTLPYYYSYINWEVDILANEIALKMTINNCSYATSLNPYLSALLNGGGNQSLVAMQPVLIDSWGMFYHVFNGTYNVKNSNNWVYSIIYGFTIPQLWLNSTPYIVINNGTNVTAYLTDPTNIEHSPIVFWWYNPGKLMYNDLPADGENVTFYTWYMLNPNLPIYFEKIEQNVTVEYYNSTVYEIPQQP